MLHQKSLDSAIGDNNELFSNKMKWLKNKWKDATDSEELRVMHPLITGQPSDINLAIIADNLEYFKKHYKQFYGADPSKAIDRACLCGSRKIADFLLAEFKFNYTSDKSDFVLSLASASMNQDWIKEIATARARANKPMPDEIYALADDPTIDMITEIYRVVKEQNAKESSEAREGGAAAAKPK